MGGVRQRRLVAGMILIAVGLLFYVSPRLEGYRTEYLLVGLGVILTAAYIASRRYGLLIPGCILTGFGLGVALDDSLRSLGDGAQIGLGVGFIAIYLIEFLRERRARWWPLVPGGFLVLSGLDLTEEVAEYLFDHWALMLVLIGVLLVLGGLRGSTSRRAGWGASKNRPR